MFEVGISINKGGKEMTEYNEDMEARMMALEARISFNEERLAALERRAWPLLEAKPKRAKRELTLEEKKAISGRLSAGREAARAMREHEARQAAKKEKKEVTDGASTAED